jgi:2-oxoisovalerate dehydrogenase E1 component
VGESSNTSKVDRMSSRFALDAVLKTKLFKKALASRFVDEKLLDLFAQGQLSGTVHTCIGQELSGVVAEFLRPEDTIFSNHRCHGHFLWRTGDIEGLIAELMGRRAGVCGGLGGSQHLCSGGFFSNGIQGGIAPIAAGLALAHKLEARGNVSVVFIGDGTLGEGVLYETFNIASKWQLPLLFVLEDNKYSQSTSQEETLAGEICARPAAFGIETLQADTWNFENLYALAGIVIEKMRADCRPRLLCIETYRLKAHSKGDDTRPREIIEPFERRDPVNRFLEVLSDADRIWVDELRARVDRAVTDALHSATAALPESAPSLQAAPSWSPARLSEHQRVVTALNEALVELLEQHRTALVLGEDVLSPYGGAFKVTKGLSERFPDRVRNTPISEACIVGMGAGLGLKGFFPIVEIMFGDFMGLAFDQLVNHAAKFHQMYNGQVTANLVVRTPMGGGRGYGPTHSQTLDRHFIGVPGLRVLALNPVIHPRNLYAPLMDPHSGPTLVIENKRMYSGHLLSEAPSGYEILQSGEPFPAFWVRPQAQQVELTLLGYGGTSEMLFEACEALFEEHDLVAQVLVITQIYPFSCQPLLEAIEAAPKLIIVEEGQGFAGVGAEITAQLAEQGVLAHIEVRRLAPQAYCIPASADLERQMLPSKSAIIDLALSFTRP